MLRISKLTDYAVVLATYLAGQGREERHNVRDLASVTGIHPPTVSKILKHLARCGIVESQRGARGGYRLAARPDQIPIASIIEALEGPIAVTECASEETSGACEYEGRCDVQANWQQINAVVNRALASVSLADMRSPEPAPQLVTLGVPPAVRTTEAGALGGERPGPLDAMAHHRQGPTSGPERP
jgi:FeS assembly SUF system regulator